MYGRRRLHFNAAGPGLRKEYLNAQPEDWREAPHCEKDGRAQPAREEPHQPLPQQVIAEELLQRCWVPPGPALTEAIRQRPRV
jgi:hypothetical protein